MRIALISDIHANMDALRVVLGEIDRQVDTSKGDEIWCLGDIIGYGPDPVECVDEQSSRGAWVVRRARAESHARCGVGVDLAAQIQEKLFDELDAPIHRVSSIDAPQIYCKRLEDQQLPNAQRVVAEALKVLA